MNIEHGEENVQVKAHAYEQLTLTLTLTRFSAKMLFTALLNDNHFAPLRTTASTNHSAP